MKIHWVYCCLGAFLAFAIASADTDPARPDRYGQENRIVFTAKVPTSAAAGEELYQIFSMRTDGRGLIQLTNNAFDNCDPHWTGGPIVMERGRHDWDTPKWEIWIMDADGGNERLLAAVPEGAQYCYNPRIAPDGKRVVYFVAWGANQSILHRVDLENGGEQTIPLPEDAQWSIYWHPDGQSLIIPVGQGSFWSESSYALQRFDLSTGQGTELIPADGRTSWSGQVSPDSTRLVFHQNVLDGRWDEREIKVLNLADGTLSEPIAQAIRFDRDPRPTWSADGQTIYYNASLTEGENVRTTMLRIPSDGSGAAVELTGLPTSSYVGIPNVARLDVASELPPPTLSVRIHEVSRSENVMELTVIVTDAEEPLRTRWNIRNDEAGTDWGNGEIRLVPRDRDATVTCYSPGTYTIEVEVVDAHGIKGSADITIDKKSL